MQHRAPSQSVILAHISCRGTLFCCVFYELSLLPSSWWYNNIPNISPKTRLASVSSLSSFKTRPARPVYVRSWSDNKICPRLSSSRAALHDCFENLCSLADIHREWCVDGDENELDDNYIATICLRLVCMNPTNKRPVC